MRDICLSLPCIVGAGGTERVLFPALDSDEEAALRASAAKLTEAFATLDSDKGHQGSGIR